MSAAAHANGRENRHISTTLSITTTTTDLRGNRGGQPHGLGHGRDAVLSVLHKRRSVQLPLPAGQLRLTKHPTPRVPFEARVVVSSSTTASVPPRTPPPLPTPASVSPRHHATNELTHHKLVVHDDHVTLSWHVEHFRLRRQDVHEGVQRRVLHGHGQRRQQTAPADAVHEPLASFTARRVPGLYRLKEQTTRHNGAST